MQTTNNIATMDASSLTSHPAISSIGVGHTVKWKKELQKNAEPNINKTRTFKDIIKEKFSSIMPMEDAKVTKIDDEAYLSSLQDAVHEAGDALSETVSTEHISAYKKAIKAFVEHILNRAYEVENIVTGNLNPARKKAWTIVKVINKKLDKLISDLMFNQIKKIEILKRINEIKGLIVDLKG